MAEVHPKRPTAPPSCPAPPPPPRRADHLAPWQLLPTKPGVCPQCAVDHAPEEPHKPDSLTYQYTFFRQHARWPNWADAMAHCPPAMREAWTKALEQRGIAINA